MKRSRFYSAVLCSCHGWEVMIAGCSSRNREGATETQAPAGGTDTDRDCGGAEGGCSGTGEKN